MSTVTTDDGVEIFYKDWSQGQPIMFHHGWPLSADDWDAQLLFFFCIVGTASWRSIAAGHGRSSQVSDGHDMDHYAADAAAVVEHLDLSRRCPYRPLHRGRRCGPLRRTARERQGLPSRC